MTDLIERMKEALGEYEKALFKYGNPPARDVLAMKARTLLPEAIEDIKRLEAKANQMVADKINLRSELLSVQAKLAKAVEALEKLDVGEGWAAQIARTTLAELTGGKEE